MSDGQDLSLGGFGRVAGPGEHTGQLPGEGGAQERHTPARVMPSHCTTSSSPVPPNTQAASTKRTSISAKKK